ncbi:response regulator transcription factor [Enterococcus sp. HY326]|uniref:response regulator transcription factor n=1 Tax=Enterococcus sp. HY326 TaxID=2971265 RepID=UPI0022403885|nr:response regulator transcription factor [Enterococcus sp. HY326]
MAHKILVLDDDISILRLIKNVLEDANYTVVTRSKITDIDICDFTGFNLIILDVMMPVNGLDICAYIRQPIQTPILFLTAKNLEQDMLAGIQAGADDYITKPFSVKELLARVNMHIRRDERHNLQTQLLTFGQLSIDYASKEVKILNELLPITKREFELIYLLASHPERPYTIDEIYEYLYPQSSDTQWRSISEFIYQIRQKMKPYHINPIKTIWGGGYRWQLPEALNN